MTKQMNVRLSGPGWEKLDELTRLYGSQVRAVEVAVDRLYRSEAQEEAMNEQERYNGYRIVVEYSDASLWGDVDPEAEGYDEYESAQAYERGVRHALECEFPGAEIKIVRGINDRLTVEDDEGPSPVAAMAVEHVVGEAYQDFDAWMIEQA